MLKSRLRATGATLIELMVAMAIFLVISYLVLSSTLTSRTTSSVSQALIFLNSQAQQASSTITHELLQAKTSDVYYNVASCAGSPCIGFRVPVVDASGGLVLVGGALVYGDGQTQDNYIRYILVGTNLQRQTLASDKTTVVGTTRTLAQNLSAGTGFAVSYDDPTYILSLTFSINTYQGITLPTPLRLDPSILDPNAPDINVAVVPQN